MSLHAFQVSWIRQRDVHILTMGGVVYTSDPRVAVSQHSDKGDDSDLWTMTIRATRVTDTFNLGTPSMNGCHMS